MPKKGVEPAALKRWRLAHSGKKHRTMASKKGKSRGRSGGRRRIRHHTKGLIGQATGAVRKVGYLPLKVAGPLMIGAGGLMLTAPVTSRLIGGGLGFKIHDTNTWAGAAEDIKGAALPAGILVGLGVITTKIVGKVLH